MAITDRNGLFIAAWTERASPAEVTLVNATLQSRWTKDQPERLLGDKAYDSDALDREWQQKVSKYIAQQEQSFSANARRAAIAPI